MMHKIKGFFISFEGGEGSGKSTQMMLLAESLRKQGREIVTTREPGGTKGGEIIRHLLLCGAAEPYGRRVEAFLFAAARADHVDEVIRPAVNAGKIVLCDRFIDSTRVYQGDEENQAYIRALEQVAILDMRPHLTFLLDLPTATGLARANERRGAAEKQDRFEKETLTTHERRRQAFLELARQEPYRFIIIDATRSKDEIAADIAILARKRIQDANA